MRYIRMYGSTQYCGTDFEEFLCTDLTDSQLDEYLADSVAENADQYEYLVWGWDVYSAEEYAEVADVTVEEAEEMKEEYFADAWGDWEEISEQEYIENGGRLRIMMEGE